MLSIIFGIRIYEISAIKIYVMQIKLDQFKRVLLLNPIRLSLFLGT